MDPRPGQEELPCSAETPLWEGGRGPSRAGGAEVAGAGESPELQPPGSRAVGQPCCREAVPAARQPTPAAATAQSPHPCTCLESGFSPGKFLGRRCQAGCPGALREVPCWPEVAKVGAGQMPPLPPPGRTHLSTWGWGMVMLTPLLCPKFAAGGRSQVQAVEFPPRLGESKHRWGLPAGNGLRVAWL